MPVGIRLHARTAISDGAKDRLTAMLAPMAHAPGHRALRKGRHSQTGGIYLVTFATLSRQRIFADFTIARAACHTFEPSAEAESATLLCWVLMPDHFHGVLRLDGTRTASQAVQRLKSQSAHACAAHGVTARIWARAFHDHAVREDEDVQAIARYVIANPIRADLATHARQYPFWNAVWL